MYTVGKAFYISQFEWRLCRFFLAVLYSISSVALATCKGGRDCKQSQQCSHQTALIIIIIEALFMIYYIGPYVLTYLE